MRKHFWMICLILLFAISDAHAGACPAGAGCAGKVCTNLGTTQLADDRASIIVCLQKTGDDATLLWKSMSGGGGVPVGSIIAWPVAIDPPDMDSWLECKGQTITQTIYPELYAVVGNKVPDLRGLFLRGLGGNSAALGVAQNYGTYVPNASVSLSLNDISVNGLWYNGIGESYIWYYGPGGGSGFSASQTISTGVNETRPMNMAVRYFIRAKP